MAYLQEHAGLQRKIEFLPDAAQLQQRLTNGQGFANPEIAVLMAYSKMHLQDALLAGDLPDDAAFNTVLVNYFPQAMQSQYANEIENHYLRREIIANQVANQVVNRMGISFVQRLSTEMGRSIDDVVRAYWIASELYQAERHFKAIEAWDNQVNAELQMRLMAALARLISRVARGLLKDHAILSDMHTWQAQYGEPVQDLLSQLPALIKVEDHPSVAHSLETLGAEAAIDDEAAQFFARLPYAENLLNLIDLSTSTQQPLAMVAEYYFDACAKLNSDWLYHTIAALPRENHWQNQACLAIREDTQNLLLDITKQMLVVEDASSEVVLEQKLELVQRQVAAMQPYSHIDLAMLSALLRSINKIVH